MSQNAKSCDIIPSHFCLATVPRSPDSKDVEIITIKNGTFVSRLDFLK